MPAVEADNAPVGDIMEDDFKRKREEMQRVAKDCIVVVDNVPKIGPEKYQRLLSKLLATFSKYAKMRHESDEDGEDADDADSKQGGGGGSSGGERLTLARNADGGTTGFAFAEFVSPEEAHKAIRSLHNLQFDKSHCFWACTAGDLERLQSVPETFVPPETSEVQGDRPNFKSWLLDDRGRDQFMIRHEDTTSIFWHDHVMKPQLDYARIMWTEAASIWSPRGTFLASFHPRGIKLWGRVDANPDENKGVEWVFVMRFEHNNVSLIDFSPCENYLITFNGTEPERDDKRNPRALIIWDIVTGKKKRGFMGPPRSMIGPEGSIPWPIFQWSFNDKYFARLTENSIGLYQTPDMGLLNMKSIKVPNIQQLAWSPTDNIMAYWAPEVEDSPARVTLMELPSKREMRQKALFSVSSIMLHWQQEGKFLCCKVDRLTKSRKGQYSNFELFRVKAKDIPVEVLEYKEKDEVHAFGWEPQGNRFAVIHGYTETPGKTDVSFFTMEGVYGELKTLFTLENKAVNEIRWSPKGRFVLLAAMGTRSGNLEWYDVNEAEKRDEPEPIGVNEHFQCNEVQWDPSGRFVATSVTYWRHMTDNAYAIWSMYGKELCRANVDQLYQFMWRPRPKSVLTSREEKDVKKNLKDRRDRYEREDKDVKDTVSSGKAARRKEQRDEFYGLQKQAKERLETEMSKRTELLAVFYGAEEELSESITETVETVVSVKTVVDRTRKLLTSDDERD